MKKESSLFTRLGYLWIIIPILIFFVGYCNIFYSILGTALIIFASYFALKNAPKLWFPDNKKDTILLCVIGVISIIWVYSSGIGAYAFQNLDHNCRNPIFELMVKESWPVLSSDGSAILTYYIGFWFVPALIGKIFNSVDVGYFAQLIWASIGVFLVFYYSLCSLKNKNIIPVLVFIFFSGLDALGLFFMPQFLGSYGPMLHLEWWAGYYQFSSMTTQLYWVFNQALPAWLLCMLIFHEKNNKNIVFLYTCMFIFSTFPAIGFFPFVLYFMIKNIKGGWDRFHVQEYIKKSLKEVYSFQNIVGLALIFPITYIYLSGNISSASKAFCIPNMFIIAIIFLPFFLIEAGIYLILIYKKYKKSPLYYLIILTLLCYPFICIGHDADFCMRATVPSLVFLYLLIVKALEDVEFQRNKIIHYCLILALLIGSVTAFNEMSRTVVNTLFGVTKVKSNLSFNNFFGYVNENRFLKYFGKNKK